MTSIEPPSGYEDLAAQTEQLNRDRAQFELDKAALVRARRADAAQDFDTTAEPRTAAAPAVIDPDGQEFELGDDGEPLRDDDGNLVPQWPHEVLELNGRTIQVRRPQPQALQAFALAASKYTNSRTQTNMVALFVKNHISPRSYDELLRVMMDPNDPNPFVNDDFGKLMQEIAKLGSGRPTGPSRS